MKQILSFFLLTLILVSCGTDGHHFKLDGQFLNLNQGEFYVYSPDGGIEGVDTLRLVSGKFSYEIPCDSPCVLMVVFPNFYEQPVFAAPGKHVKMKGDATHLRQLTVKGTDENEQMNTVRERILHASPTEAVQYAREYIEDKPLPLVGTYLLIRYFIQTEQPDYDEARRLAKLLQAINPTRYLATLLQQLEGWNVVKVGQKLPKFTAVDMKGKKWDDSKLSEAPVCVVSVWSDWNYMSLTQQRCIRQFCADHPGKMQAFSICLEADTLACGKTMRREKMEWPVVCDGKMFDSPYYRMFGFQSVSDNLVLQHGKVVARSLSYGDLRKKLQELLYEEHGKQTR